jgi:hypothetical protein
MDTNDSIKTIPMSSNELLEFNKLLDIMIPLYNLNNLQATSLDQILNTIKIYLKVIKDLQYCNRQNNPSALHTIFNGSRYILGLWSYLIEIVRRIYKKEIISDDIIKITTIRTKLQNDITNLYIIKQNESDWNPEQLKLKNYINSDKHYVYLICGQIVKIQNYFNHIINKLMSGPFITDNQCLLKRRYELLQILFKELRIIPNTDKKNENFFRDALKRASKEVSQSIRTPTKTDVLPIQTENSTPQHIDDKQNQLNGKTKQIIGTKKTNSIEVPGYIIPSLKHKDTPIKQDKNTTKTIKVRKNEKATKMQYTKRAHLSLNKARNEWYFFILFIILFSLFTTYLFV